MEGNERGAALGMGDMQRTGEGSRVGQFGKGPVDEPNLGEYDCPGSGAHRRLQACIEYGNSPNLLPGFHCSSKLYLYYHDVVSDANAKPSMCENVRRM